MLDHDNIVYQKWGAPMFKGPISDAFLNIRNAQCSKDCGPYELLYMDCMEAYGYHRGKEKCRLVLDDLYECVFKIKRIRRLEVMANERLRQYKNGKRDKIYEEAPPLDLY